VPVNQLLVDASRDIAAIAGIRVLRAAGSDFDERAHTMHFLMTAGSARLRLIFAAATLALAGLLAAAFVGSAARAADASRLSWAGKTKPVIVLEHGAWADSSSWDQVIGILTHEGFTVYAPPDPLRGLASDSVYLRDFLTENAALAGKPVVLVGHSYGGRSSPTPQSATGR
jgi:pimeloyl-ACP methyl ester carboxylesterase